MEGPISLRDLRRLRAKDRAAYSRWNNSIKIDVWTTIKLPDSEKGIKDLNKWIDSQIGKYGPDFEMDIGMYEIRYAPKDTSEVADSSGGDGELHGGDGSSGEVEDAQYCMSSSAGQDDKVEDDESGSGVDAGSSSDCQTEDGNPDLMSNGQKPSTCAEEEADRIGKKSSENTDSSYDATMPEPGMDDHPAPQEEGTNLAEKSLVVVDVSNADVDNVEPDEAQSPDSREEAKKPSLLSISGRTPLYRYGGAYADEETARAAAKKLRKEYLKLSVSLMKLVKKYEPGPLGDASPRVDKKKLVKEMIIRRFSLSRTHKEEMEPRHVVLAVDWSGSCSSYCSGLLAAALSLAENDKRVIVVAHSNGFIDGVWGQQANKYRLDDKQDSKLWWKNIAIKIGLLIAIGDCDAEWAYKECANAGADVIWFDNYGCSRGPFLPNRQPEWCDLILGVSHKNIGDAIMMINKMR